MFIICNSSLLLLGFPSTLPILVPIKCKLWFVDTDHCTEQLGEDLAGAANR